MPARLSLAGWRAEAERRYGPHSQRWRFRCPVCGWAASVEAWRAAGAPLDAIAVACIGRWTLGLDAIGIPGGPCTYDARAGWQLNPIAVNSGDPAGPQRLFDFAHRPLTTPARRQKAIAA